MANEPQGDYVKVTVADPIGGTASVVTFRVGDSLEGTNPVALLGGRYKESDPWIADLKRRIATRRVF